MIERRVVHLWNGLEALRAEGVLHDLPRHMHRVFCVGVVEQGMRECFMRGRWHSIRAGEIFIVNPGEVHACRSGHQMPYTYRALCFSSIPEGLRENRRDGVSWKLPSPKIEDENLANCHRLLVQACLQAETANTSEKLGADFFSRLLEYAEPRFDLSTNDRRAVDLVREYLESHYTQKISLGELAELSGYSSFHLNRIFLKDQGIPPHAYQNLIRVRHAKLGMEAGQSIAEVALAAGFTDQSHLSRVFKAIVGMTPGQYYRTTGLPNH